MPDASAMAEIKESRAHVALRAKVDREGQKAFCARTGVKQPTLSQLVNAKRSPGRKVARLLERAGIRQAWWDEPWSAA